MGIEGACLSVCLLICLSVCIFVCLLVYLHACQCACLSACLSVCLSTCLLAFQPVCLPVCLHACLCACLCVCLPLWLLGFDNPLLCTLTQGQHTCLLNMLSPSNLLSLCSPQLLQWSAYHGKSPCPTTGEDLDPVFWDELAQPGNRVVLESLDVLERGRQWEGADVSEWGSCPKFKSSAESTRPCRCAHLSRK